MSFPGGIKETFGKSHILTGDTFYTQKALGRFLFIQSHNRPHCSKAVMWTTGGFSFPTHSIKQTVSFLGALSRRLETHFGLFLLSPLSVYVVLF